MCEAPYFENLKKKMMPLSNTGLDERLILNWIVMFRQGVMDESSTVWLPMTGCCVHGYEFFRKMHAVS